MNLTIRVLKRDIAGGNFIVDVVMFQLVRGELFDSAPH